jgi:hypothetical protein
MLKSDSLHIRIAVESDAPALAAFAGQTLWLKGSIERMANGSSLPYPTRNCT